MTTVRDMYCKFLTAEAILVIVIFICVRDAATTFSSNNETSSSNSSVQNTNNLTSVLGCSFVNDADGSFRFSLESITDSAVWGTPTEPYDITKGKRHVDGKEVKEAYENFLETLKEMRKRVITNVRFDHTDMFLKFLLDYKAQNTQDLSSFYKSYKYTYDASVAQPAYEIFLFNDMVKATGNPSLLNNFFMISAYSQLSEDYLKTMNYGEPPNFSHQYTAGALRIQFYDEGELRSGLIIVDLSLNIAEETGAIVLMNDRAYPHYDTSKQYDGLKVKFEYADSDHQYVISKVYTENGLFVNSRNLYYIGKPYCSFVDTTLKPMLLMSIHGMMNRQGNGFQDSFVNFLALPLTELKKKNETEHSFYIQYKNSSGVIKHKAIKFRDAENRNFQVETHDMIKEVCDGLCVNIDNFLDKMGAISKHVMKNETLLTQLFELSKQYHLINSQTTYQTELLAKFPDSEVNERVVLF